MTSEVDTIKTNDLLHRRKLRLQQVREQSKEIAKKIRERAKVETLRQEKIVGNKKEKEYLECQKQFINKLQEIYTNGVQNIGAGHKNASDINQKDYNVKIDKSKLRGKEATAELRRKKQEVLDKKKELLDRKLQAREAANELSREKSSAIAKTFQITNKDPDVATDNKELNISQIENSTEPVKKVDMATQLNLNDPLCDGQSDIPLLVLPETESLKDIANDVAKNDRSRRLNLFALSDEMPSSLRGGSSADQQFNQQKPSLTLVSEYIQNRRLRLREFDTKCSKKPTDDLQNIKQTIQRTRASKTEGHANNKENSVITSTDTAMKGSVVMYNHATRNTKTVPCYNENIVVRDQNDDDNAFTKAQKEETNDNLNVKELQNKITQRRNRIAVTKENVEKEYRDTLAFLNSIPKDMSNRPIKEAYMDENRQQQLKERYQKKLQAEYKNIQSEHTRRKCKHVRSNIQSRSKSPMDQFEDCNNDIQYSWMPVPDAENNLGIHNIPNHVKHGNSVKFSMDNGYHEYRSGRKHTPPTKDKPVKTKLPKNKYVEALVIEENDAESTGCYSITSDSSSLEDLNLKRRRKKEETSEGSERNLSNADRIVIYKILNSKNDKKKKCHKKSKLVDKNHSSNGIIQDPIEECLGKGDSKKTSESTGKPDNIMSKASFEQLTEGIYKAVNNNGDNMNTLQFSENPSENKLPNEGDTPNHKTCSCAKTNIQDVQTNTIPTESGSTERPINLCDATKLSIPETQTIHYPSAATSTSSIKAVINEDKTQLSDDGYIKLIDKTAQENGKFYVGTTGFLKDEAYEVIIQLRKKEINNIGNTKKHHDADIATEQNANVSSQNPVASVPHEVERNETSTNAVVDGQVKEPINPSKTQSFSSKLSDNHVLSASTRQLPQNVTSHTEESKVDDVSNKTKNAISTYTQTTNSPIHRPIFMHMSSSTSTAYMSPPELIMPRFLKRDYSPSCDDTYNSMKESKHTKSSNCNCKHRYKKKSSQHINLFQNYKKINHRTKHSATPPNTATSVSGVKDIYHNFYETTPDSISSGKFGTCSKCKNCRRHKKQNKNVNVHHRNKPKTQLHDVNNATDKHIKNVKSNELKRANKNSLNPIVKQYVNKLLELNKEGLKTVDILNEECSSVTTPSSSIINDSLNMNPKLLTNKKISLEQIKNILKEKIINEYKNIEKNNSVSNTSRNNQSRKHLKSNPKASRRKQLHKVKSLKISRKILKTNEFPKYHPTSSKSNSTTSSFRNDTSDHQPVISLTKASSQKSSMSVRKNGLVIKTQKSVHDTKPECNFSALKSNCLPNTDTVSIDNEPVGYHNNHDVIRHQPAHISTQTSIDSEHNFMKVAEGKLQNMEKIADLTEKCTKRLSNLAKVLEEVRKNKSLAYSQITSSESTSESESERLKKKSVDKSLSPLAIFSEVQSPLNPLTPPAITSDDDLKRNGTNNFIPLLSDIPKPMECKTPKPQVIAKPEMINKEKENFGTESSHMKLRGKPPPALSRIYLKNEEVIVPHELSTVLEVDSPMSLKFKSQSRNDINTEVSKISNTSSEYFATKKDYEPNIMSQISGRERLNPDLVNANKNGSEKNTETLTNETSDDSKLQMMDLKQFNEIMLKPFISIREYTKKQYMDNNNESSNNGDHLKEILTNDDLSSFNSEGSLPDVIAELLKRKIISEPFKFDTPSNVNTSTLSSESTVSLLTLSNVGKGKKKSSILFHGKKNIAETSDTLSISSNPDLENAFQKLGMGWASSTLKKTKERLALSSSSNTSSSSGVQLRSKILNNPSSNGDSTSLPSNFKSPRLDVNTDDVSQLPKQQAKLSNSMTVKEFLTTELAKKITFSNKSTNNLTEPEFVSLYETKMPEEMKKIIACEGDQSGNSINNCTNNRARTSTPVHIFKSSTFQSSSSSNTSNGLFSNVDDLSSVKVTSNSIRNHSTSDKDDLTIPNCMLKISKQSDCSKSD
ncbi:putative leucine-rich repeat-containing protein DDB_G0290503 isoform X2 [Battus philenor]|uniref:putative leucine-rich repeat-containing protein DDB_G0290503 isoform X2 n=1 Tax=Battus philenor TaxID=42288 RepID=UPI0035D01287